MLKNNTNNNIAYSTLVIIAVSVLAKFTSFITEAILAAYLGTTYQSDAYYMVASIKDVIYPMLSVGIWKVFLPIYKEKITLRENTKAAEIANKVITLFTIASIIVTLIILVFSDVVVMLVAPGFSDETKALCSQLVKISSPMYIFIIASAVYSSMLQCQSKFFASQIREVASYIPTIIAGLVFCKIWGVKALAVGLVLGGLLRLIIELPFVDWGYKYKPDFKIKDPELKFMFKRLPSALVSEGVNQFNTLIDKIMASSLPSGAVSSLSYGNKLTNVFSGLFSSAVATALYPQVVELVALDRKKELSDLISKIINIFAMLMIPMTFACSLFAEDLVTVVFMRGAFNNDSVSLTSGVFSCYCISLFFVGCNTVLTNVFYGYGDTKTPMYISMVNLIANVIGNFVFIYLWGVKGLALSTSASAIIAFLFRLIFIKKYVILNYRKLFITVIKMVLVGGISCVVPRFFCSLLDLSVYIELVIASIIGIAFYFVLVKLFKIKEFYDLLRMFTKKLKKKS